MASESTGAYRFGDLLALARLRWVKEMERRLGAAGFADYRRSDAAALRLLAGTPRTLTELAASLGVTRQAARKVLDGLVRRGYATEGRDPRDSRRLEVALSNRGVAYAASIVATIEALNSALAARVSPADLAAADRVLRAVLDETTRERVGRRIAPPS